MQKTFVYYTDPSHGWAKVPVKLLTNIGIADKITSYSYYRNGNAFLEEDKDLLLLVNRLKQLKVESKFRNENSDHLSEIRNYESYDNSHYSIKIMR